MKIEINAWNYFKNMYIKKKVPITAAIEKFGKN